MALPSLYRLLEDERLNHVVEVIDGVWATQCSTLLTNFFRALREKKKRQKQRRQQQK